MGVYKKILRLVDDPTPFKLIRWKLREWFAMRRFRAMGIKIGNNTTVSPAAVFMDYGMVEIGEDCSISGVFFVTHDGGARILSKLLQKKVVITKPIKIGNRCVIGAGVHIKYGVTIGDDCIIAMGSVIHRDVPPGTMMGGNPAERIGETASYRERIDRESN